MIDLGKKWGDTMVKLAASFEAVTRSFAELGQQLRRASRQARRKAARAGTRGRRGARSLAPFGLPWVMYRELHEEDRA
jgi:hypothetical protein